MEFARWVAAFGLLGMTMAAVGRQDEYGALEGRIAPELRGDTWLNTEPDQKLSLEDRKGKVTLVAFWTFGCSNCQANLPGYARLYKRFKPKDVELIAIHTPETEEEHKLEAVKEHVKEFGIDYPVLIDNDGKNWFRWNQKYWPSLYVLDGEGRIRFRWIGELDYQHAGGEAKVVRAIEQLLRQKPKSS